MKTLTEWIFELMKKFKALGIFWIDLKKIPEMDFDNLEDLLIKGNNLGDEFDLKFRCKRAVHSFIQEYFQV